MPKTPTSSKNPFRTHARSKSTPKANTDSVRSGSKSPDTVASRSSTSSRHSSRTVHVKTDELAWRTPYPLQRPPLLSLAVPSPSRKPRLETIPGSPPYNQTAQVFEPPSFALPSEAAQRRAKMRRVRKMLGDGVPTELVFPSSPEESESESEEDSPVVDTPTSTMSREWLLVKADKPLPSAPVNPFMSAAEVEVVPQPEEEPIVHKLRPSMVKKMKEPSPRRNLLFKSAPKEKPSKGAKRLESIAESNKETRPDSASSLTIVGVSASAGMSGKGKSRRFVEGELMFDQIGTVWGW